MKYILPFILIIFSVTVYADKYDDFVAEMKRETPNVAFYKYQLYQKEKPEIGNVYYQLAQISYDYLLQANPIYDIKAFRYYAYNSKLYYNNCLHFATENDVKKYSTHYTNVNFSKKPNLAALNKHIRPILEDIARITDAGNKLHAEYVRLSSQYERCIQIYLTLNTKFESLNDALLRATSDDIKAMHELQSISDSIPEYIIAYKKSLENYKIKGYDPTFDIVPIELFRIDALCSVNFLTNNIVLYDFGAWVRQFEKQRDTRVMPILDEAQKAYKQSINKIDFQASTSLINSLYQLDDKSYPATILQIRNVYNQVKYNSEKFEDAPNDDRRLAMLYDMKTVITKAKELHIFLQDLSSAEMQKYPAFTSTYFSNATPYDISEQIIKQTDSIYNKLLQDFRITKSPILQQDSNVISVDCGMGLQAKLHYQPSKKYNQFTIESTKHTIIKKNIDIDAPPHTMYYLKDADQLILAHNVLNDSLATLQTQFAIYDIQKLQLSEWITLPQINRIAYITMTNDGYAMVVNEDSTESVILYLIDSQKQIIRRPIHTEPATIISVGHYNSDMFVVYLTSNQNPHLLLIGKK